MCLNDTYPLCKQPLSGNCHSICFSKPVLWTATSPRSFFVTQRAQQHRARMQSVAVLPSHAPHGSKARLIVVPNRRDSWRSHVHRTRFGKHCSSSSYRPAMSGVEGEGPSSLSLGGCKGGCSLSEEREQPPFCALPRGAGGPFKFCQNAITPKCSSKILSPIKMRMTPPVSSARLL